MPAHRRLRVGDRRGDRGVHIRHDQPGHRLRRMEPGLVLLLPGRPAAGSDPAQQVGPRTSGGYAMTSTVDTTTTDATAEAAGAPLVRLTEAGKHYGNIIALSGITLEVSGGG